MARVIFYEKPGCAGNARQKSLLIGSGHDVETRNLLTAPWDATMLRPFFGDKPIAEWFNASSPRIKNGEVRPAELKPEVAIAMMIEDPLLIRRPLLQVGERRESGFDQARVAGLDRAEADAAAGHRHMPETGRCRPRRGVQGGGGELTVLAAGRSANNGIATAPRALRNHTRELISRGGQSSRAGVSPR